jgi:hypothetical protein
MASSSTWPDGNELIDFGKPFKGRPEYADVKFSYSNNDGDSCDIYIILEIGRVTKMWIVALWT